MTSGHSRPSVIAVLGVSLLTLLGPTGCSSEDQGPTTAGAFGKSTVVPSNTNKSTDVSSPRSGEPPDRFTVITEPPTAAPTPTRKAPLTPVQQCRARQLKAAHALEYPMMLASDRVSASTTGASRWAGTRARTRVDSSYAKVAADCAVPPFQMDRFHDTVTRLTDRAMDRTRLETLLSAYAAWAGPLGVRHADQYVNQVRRCTRLGDRIRTGYAVWEEPAPYGKDTWIQLIVHNNTNRRAY